VFQGISKCRLLGEGSGQHCAAVGAYWLCTNATCFRCCGHLFNCSYFEVRDSNLGYVIGEDRRSYTMSQHIGLRLGKSGCGFS
jgi:hypothetical protein